MDPPKAPRHLKKATRAWWAAVVSEWDLEDHHVRLLTMAGESWDVAQEAGAVVRRDGLTYTDRWGQPRPRPEVAIQRDAMAMFARLVKDLGLDIEPPGSIGRPPEKRR